MKEKKKEYLSSLVEQKEGKLTAVASDETVDRMGDSLSIDNWDFKNFKKNPVLQLSHDYSQVPIGVVKNLKIVGKKMTFEPVFHEFTQAAREVKKLYEEGIMKAFSVGFIYPREEKGKFELLEISAVAIPANPTALICSKSVKAEDMTKIKAWVTSEKEVEAEIPDEKLVDEVEETVDETVDEVEETVDEVDTEIKEEVTETKATKETEEKADSVQEQLDENETRKKKWTLLNNIDNAVYAFYNVYMNTDIPLEDFKKLTLELSGIIKNIANGKKGFDAKGSIKEVEGSMKDFFREDGEKVESEKQKEVALKIKVIQDEIAELKAGKVISKKNQVMISGTIKNLEGTIETLKKLVDAEEENKKEELETKEEKDVEQENLDIKVEEEKKDIEIKKTAKVDEAIILKAMQQVAKNANLALNKLKQDNK